MNIFELQEIRDSVDNEIQNDENELIEEYWQKQQNPDTED